MKRNILHRLTACLCLCALLCGGLTVPAKAAGFKDVTSGHWAAEAISQCVTQGWFQGKSVHTFGVGQPMTRAAFAVVLSRFFGWQDHGAYYQIFSDVPQGAWYEPALRACYEHGAVTRQTDSFRPADAVTREELAVMLLRAMGYGSMTGFFSKSALPFRDVTTNRGYIAMAYEMGLVNGMSGNLFAPGRAATREQAAVMLSRLYGKLHPVQEESMAILRQGEDRPDLTGYQTVILMAGSLAGGQIPQFTANLGGVQIQARKAAQADGKKVLLGVSGQTSVLKSSAAAQRLAQAVSDGGYDGLYLDISQQAAADSAPLTRFVQAVRAAMPDGKLYVAADAPVSGQSAPDYTALGKTADRIVLRVPAYADASAAVPVSAMEPLENICYAVSVLNDQVAAGKLSLLLTAEGQVQKSGGRFTSVDAKSLDTLIRQGTAYYSDRYACAYVETKDAVAWYLNDRALAARRQLLNCFGVNAVCVSTPNGTLTIQ